MQFLNYWSMFVGTGRFRQAYDDLDTRGGPPIVKPAAWWFDSFVGTDSRKRYRVNLGNFIWHNEEGGSDRSHRVNLTLQPRPALQATLGLQYTNALDAAQWIENTDVTGDGVDDHVYGTLKRNVVSITARTHLRVHARHDSRGLHAAVRGGRRLLEHPPVLASPRRSSSSPSSTTRIRTSTTSRCAATWCSAGSTAAAARCIWSGTCPTATTRGRASSRRFATSAAGLAPAARRC